MQFLGTGAADGIPSPFCNCDICMDAREHPQHNRLRSMFLIDQNNLIDCGPDLVAACMKLRLDLSALKRVFITHTHEDHFYAENAGALHMSRTRNGVPLDIYLSEAGFDKLIQMRKILGEKYGYLDSVRDYDAGLVSLHAIKVNEPFLCDGYRIMAVGTTHHVSPEETAINYLFERTDGQKFLYASDTGFYPPKTLAVLGGSQVDVLILEATFGSRKDNDTRSHLNGSAFLVMLDILLAERIIHPNTRVFATHINHKHAFTHRTLQEWFYQNASMNVTVAYDGLKID